MEHEKAAIVIRYLDVPGFGKCTPFFFTEAIDVLKIEDAWVENIRGLTDSNQMQTDVKRGENATVWHRLICLLIQRSKDKIHRVPSTFNMHILTN